jgi:hypothetical protein
VTTGNNPVKKNSDRDRRISQPVRNLPGSEVGDSSRQREGSGQYPQDFSQGSSEFYSRQPVKTKML